MSVKKKWLKINDFSDSKHKILDDEIYGISTLNNELYKFSADGYYEYKTSCRIGNNILVVRKNSERFSGFLELKLLDTKSKQVSDLLIETSRRYFAIVEFLIKYG